MYPKQEAAIFCPERMGVTEASTKAGKTIACLAWILEQAMKCKQGQNVWWVAPIFTQAKIAFRRMQYGLPASLYKANASEMTIRLMNGVTIWFKGADKPDSLYGEDVYAAVIDEASRVKAEAWYAVRSTLTATNGPIRMIGNVKGRKNWFFNLCRRAEGGEPDMHYAKLIAKDAVDAGVLTADEVESAKRQLPEAIFRELYLAEPSDDGGNPFGIRAIGECLMPQISDAPPVAWGIDLAKSVDWTWAIGLDEESRVCRSERWQGPWGVTKVRIRALLDEGGQALVDSTGVGDPIVEELQGDGLAVEGFKFTPASKQQLMEGLAADIQQRKVLYPDGVLRNELESYEYEYTRNGVKYSAPEGMTDDGVCALALARKKVRDGLGGMLAAYG